MTNPIRKASPQEIAQLQARAHQLIPGGCHTAAKGDDQFPEDAPAFIVRGDGCHVWDLAGNEYIEYAMGMRAVTLGHAYPSVVEAAWQQMKLGNNFNRPAALEVACAEQFLDMVPSAEMVKFTKDGSTVMTAAVKLARAYTGRDYIAMCSASPFFSYDDWFIGRTAINAGIPQAHKSLSLQFDYNDIESLQKLFDEYPGQIACVAMEPARAIEPEPGYLQQVQALCNRYGAVFLLDETITGFRWHKHGAQHLYGVTPDLSCFGKAMGNGFAISALAGKRDLMRLGGLHHTDAQRVLLLSTTHGAESPSLGAAIEVMKIYQREPVVEHLHRAGERLRAGIETITESLGLSEYFQLSGRGCAVMYTTLDEHGEASQSMRTLFLQQMLRHGILPTSFLTSYSHTDEDIDKTIEAAGKSLLVYKQALAQGVERFLVGRPSASVYRPYNEARIGN